MRTLLYGLVGLLVLLVAAVLIVPSLIDWNAQRARLAAEISEATGRQLSIDGDVSVSLLPGPALTAVDVRLANLEGGSAPDMVTLERLAIRVAPLPLLSGELQVTSIVLENPTILLEVLPDGRRNWELGAEGGAGAQDGAPTTGDGSRSDQAGGLASDVRLDSVVIEGGTVVYRDAAAGHEEQIDRLNAKIVADSLQGPATVEGSTFLRGVKTEFQLAAGRVVEKGATPLNLTMHLPGPAADLEFGGALSREGDGAALRGRLQSRGDSLAAVATDLALGGESGLPAPFAQPFTVDTELQVDREGVKTQATVLRLGDTSAEGQAEVGFGTPMRLRMALVVPQIDLDRLLELEQAQGRAPSREVGESKRASPGDASGSDSGDPSFTLPQNLEAKLELTVDAAVYRGQVVRQVRLGVDLAEGRLRIDRASALLPGASDVSLTGLVNQGEKNLQFSGRLDAESGNLRTMLDWLDVNIGDVASGRLRKATLLARIDGTPKQVNLTEIDLQFDVTKVTGGIAVALRERPGLGIGLAIDRLNLDDYLPARDGAAEDDGRSREGGEPDQPARTGSREHAGGEADGGLLDTFDANLDLRMGVLTTQGVQAHDLHFDATLQHGAFTVREASVGNIEGTGGRFSGSVRPAGLETAVDGRLSLEVADPAELASLVGTDPELPAKLGAFEVTGTIKGSLERVNLDTTLNAAGGRLHLAGEVLPLASSLDARLSVEHPNLAELTGRFVEGSPLGPDAGGLALQAQVSGDANGVAVTDLSGQLGPTEVSGSAAIDLGGDRPLLRLDLVTGELPAAMFLAGAASDGRAAPAPDRGDAPARAGGGRWSQEPLDVSALSAVDADIALEAAAIVLDQARLDQARFEASLQDGVLDIRRLSGKSFEGTVSATGQLDARDVPQLDLVLGVEGIALGQLVAETAGVDRVSGPLSLTAEIASRGNSEAELIRALSGKGTVEGTLTARLKAEEQAGAALLEVLGQKVREIRGLTDTTTTLLNAFGGAPARLTGTFAIDQGIVTTDDTRLKGHGAEARIEGDADLPDWTMDAAVRVFRQQDSDEPYVTALLTGPLDSPNPTLKGGPFERRPQPPQDDAKESAPSRGGPKPEDLLKQQPDDFIKGILEGLRN